MSRLLVAATAAPLAFGVPFVLPATVDADDQAAADTAVTVFNERLTAAGWTSTGPFTQSEPEGEEETEFGACLNGFELYLDYTDVHFDGETARAFSHSFEARRQRADLDRIGWRLRLRRCRGAHRD